LTNKINSCHFPAQPGSGILPFPRKIEGKIPDVAGMTAKWGNLEQKQRSEKKQRREMNL
jgi:hypothetical protein